MPARTRAELRRRAQGEATTSAAESAAAAAPPLTRRGSRPRLVVEASDEGAVEPPAVDEPTAVDELAVVDELADVAVERLADLAPDALEMPGVPEEVSLVVETAGSAVDVAPASLDTAPLVLPVRRSRRRPSPASESVDVEEPAIPSAPAASDRGTQQLLDEFEAAARLFAFTGETPVQVAATALAEEESLDQLTPVPPRRRGFGFKRAAAASFSIGVVGVVGLLTVGMTTPLEAVAAAKGSVAAITQTGGDVAATSSADDIQAYVAPAQVQNQAVERSDEYQTTTIAEMAAESGISNFSNFFVNDPNSAIQWPFAVGVPITYGFGMRSGTMHEGLDFVPGAGAPVQAIADGTVRIATESGGAYGVTVVIDHVIDGELVSSRYAHMQYGSLQVEAGEHVAVGTFIGRTGNTGRSFGAHTHFEILAGGTTAIDPLPWLREHAGG